MSIDGFEYFRGLKTSFRYLDKEEELINDVQRLVMYVALQVITDAVENWLDGVPVGITCLIHKSNTLLLCIICFKI